MKVTLFKQDVTGEVREWSIEKVSDDTIMMTYGLVGGLLQEKTEDIKLNQSGRTLAEQMMLRMGSRIGKRRDQGYVNNYEEARDNRSTNTLNMPKPMLAQPFKKVTIPDIVLCQYKYDGNRCMITKQNGEVYAYSRNGKLFKSIGHILFAARDMPEGMILDGELYKHGIPLQTLRSWISRDQAASEGLEYICYDYISDDKVVDRMATIQQQDFKYPILIAPTKYFVKEDLDLRDRLIMAKGLGYEGLILRDPAFGYETGKRSKSLIKVKSLDEVPLQQAEFKCVDVVPSADGWAICVCGTGRETFRVSAPGDMPKKFETMINKELYIGKWLTVDFANYTQDGIPFHPIAVAWR